MPGRILILEPDLQNRIGLKAALSQEFFDVEAVDTPEALMAAALGRRPDAVILSLDVLKSVQFRPLKTLRLQFAGAYVPLVLIHKDTSAAIWADADAALADDVLGYDTPRWLLALRLNQLIRSAEKIEAMRARRRTVEDLGFGEAECSFPPATPQSLRLDFAQSDLPTPVRDRIVAALGSHFPRVLVVDASSGGHADVTVLSDTALGEADANRAIAAHRATRHRVGGSRANPGGLLLLTEDSRRQRLQRAQELGVDDIASVTADAHELAAKIRRIGWQQQFVQQTDQSLSQQLLAAHRDPLTGLYNRRYVSQYIQQIARRAAPQGCLTVMMLDLDNFKRVNDRFGHAAGDAVLRGTAERLCDCLRSSDMVARMGGEEFLIVLSDTDAEKACHIARRLCQEIAAHPIRISSDMSIPVSASIGVSQTPPGQAQPSMDALIEAADRALYRAKAAGRNRVSFASDLAA